MIDYQREAQQTIPVEQVKIVGVGGAGANMLDRVALDGADASSMLALNTDERTLNTSMAGEKIQLGKTLTMGLGAGGDPDLGLRAAQEVETEIRDAFRNQKIVFICVGLGGGSGSGAVSLVTRLAREQGAFVVVFATMPFEFEGKRRKEQAETALNELSVLANALVTFENGKMGELVLGKQGIHEAFSAADVMISQSIKAVTRLVVKPGIINVGLDDLMSALKATKSRCLFGSGIADGENRSALALQNALNSPLLDKGALLKSATTVLVHVCGGSNMSLYEVELLMNDLAKQVPDSAHILFGAAVDNAMGENLSVTIISALPEALLISKKADTKATTSSTVAAVKPQVTEVEQQPTEKKVAEKVIQKSAPSTTPAATAAPVTPKKETKEEDLALDKEFSAPEPRTVTVSKLRWDELKVEDEKKPVEDKQIISKASTEKGTVILDSVSVGSSSGSKKEGDSDVLETPKAKESKVEEKSKEKAEAKVEKEPEVKEEPKVEKEPEVIKEPKVEKEPEAKVEPVKEKPLEEKEETILPEKRIIHNEDLIGNDDDTELPMTELPPKKSDKESKSVLSASVLEAEKPQGELALDGGPKGKFAGEAPNIVDGEDLDIPPFLRNR